MADHSFASTVDAEGAIFCSVCLERTGQKIGEAEHFLDDVEPIIRGIEDQLSAIEVIVNNARDAMSPQTVPAPDDKWIIDLRRVIPTQWLLNSQGIDLVEWAKEALAKATAPPTRLREPESEPKWKPDPKPDPSLTIEKTIEQAGDLLKRIVKEFT